MKITRRFVSFATQTLKPQRWLAAAKRKAVQLTTLAINLLLLSAVLVVADHLPFVDVPSGAFYHNAVSAVFGARITTGTTPTTFSPEDFVTRGQMAAFLHRGLGRVAYTVGSNSVYLSQIARDIAVLTINTGGAPGGTGFLKVDAAFTASNLSTTACPCRIHFQLFPDDGPVSRSHTVTLYDSSEVYFPASASGAATQAFPLPTGNLTQNVRLKAYISTSEAPVATNTIFGNGSITALWVPFGATGGNTLNAPSASPDEAPQGPQPDANPDTER